MKLELTIEDRYALVTALPARANFIKHCIINEIREKCDPSEEEKKRLNIMMHASGRMFWNQELDVPVEIELGDVAFNLIKESLENLEKANNLNSAQSKLYGRYVVGGEFKVVDHE